ncbi:ABC transporter substrate-binding protein [Rufibacter roseus]|uniref:ABC transporter substrate-binding protein n=1 Tax=Rufibacter roseus TaxID=1567108 RepID=A0ABW2DRU4_9BACT|nr:ABC transporter substrate-binding protein [Rufibacter roseus]
MRKRIVLAAAVFAFSLNLQAQSNAEQNTRLQNGKLLVDQQKYQLAMTELLPLTTGTSSDALAADAAYLYSVAASKQKNWAEADRMLNQLITQYPTWANINDARYLLGQVLFEKKEYLRALNALQTITSAELQDEVAAMKRHYMMLLTDKNTFQYLLRQFSDDATLARAYADKLVSGWYTSADKTQLEDLVRKFNLNRSYLQRTAAIKKNEYNVAVMLPFNVTEQGVQVDKRNLFVTDFYAGILSAQDSLQKQGARINLFPYDTSNDTAQVRQVMELPELASMDLIIGPVFKVNSAFASKIAKERNLNMVNPFSDDLDITFGNPFMYMMETSLATQGKRAAAYAYQAFPNKTAVVVFDSTPNDTTFAGNFRRAYIALGGKVVAYQKINSKSGANMSSALGNVNLKDLGVLVVQSSAANVSNSTVSFLEQRASKVPVLVPSAWLEMNQISLSQLDFLEMYFHYPKYIDPENSNVQQFKRAYARKYNLPPSNFTYSGFELMNYYGKQLQEKGYSAPLKLSPVQPGVFYQGIGYFNSSTGQQMQDNQYLPILKLENGRLLVMNPAF